MKFLPDMYVKDVMSIPYQKLKDKNIKCIIFDLDNTLALLSEVKPPLRVVELFKKLEKDFDIYILTNSNGKRALPYKENLSVSIINFALKPSVRGLRKIQKLKGYKKSEMVMVGDQLVTDILAGNRFNIMTIFVDAMSDIDLKITKFNRMVERRIIKKYQKKGVFEKGKYYE